MTLRSCQVASSDPENECEPQEAITAKADRVGVYMYYRYYYFNSDTYGKKSADSVVKYQYKPMLKDIG
jgi:hypothetical protein